MERISSRERLKAIILIAVFTARSYGCLLLIRGPGIAGFLTLDVKDAVVALGAMFLGPVAALLISLLVSFIEMITVSGTGFWGFLMNFLGTAVYSVMFTLQATTAFCYLHVTISTFFWIFPLLFVQFK